MSHRLQLLVPETLIARVRKASQRRRLSTAEWVRRAIDRSLAEDENNGGDPLDRLAALDGPVSDMAEMLRQIESGRT